MLEILYKKFYFWIEIASIVLAIVSYILIIVQSSNNYMFKNYKTNSLIAERLLYEQFSYEVKESIKSIPYTNNPSDNYEFQEYMKVEAKFNSYYDCKDVYDPELNEEICQNQIVENNTCCKSECCLKTNGDEIFCYNYAFDLDEEAIKNNRILYYNDEEYFEDPKRRFCSYYNKYTTDIHLETDNGELKLYKCKFDYESIYLNNAPHMCIGKEACNKDLYIDCGIIDTKYNHLFVDNINYCPIYSIDGNKDYLYTYYTSYEYPNMKNYNTIIIRIILSEIPPDIHEWKNHFVSLENYENKESEKYKNLMKKILNIGNKDFKNLMNKYSSIYKERSFSLNGDYFSNFKINSKAKIKMYTTNYIGFGNQNDLLNFLDIFKGDIDNPLYRLGKEVYPSLETIIYGAVLFVLCIIYLILFLTKSIEKYLWVFIIKECILGATFFIILGIYIWQLVTFKKIKIDMDSNFENILDLYNNRRMQYCLLIALILLFISIMPFLIFLIIKLIQKCKNRANQPLENQERPQQANANRNSPSHCQNQNPEEQQTIERPNPNQNENALNSENQHLNANNNITENIREGNDVIIHDERNQSQKK